MNGNSDFTGDMNIAGKTIVTSTDQIINLNAGGTGTLTMETSGSGDVITRATGSGGARMVTDNGPVQISAGGTGPIDIATASKDIKVQVGGTGGLNMLTNNGPIKIDAGGTGPIDIATASKDSSNLEELVYYIQTNNGSAAVLAGGTGNRNCNEQRLIMGGCRNWTNRHNDTGRKHDCHGRRFRRVFCNHQLKDMLLSVEVQETLRPKQTMVT